MISSVGLDGYMLSQNLGLVQKERPDRNILGPGRRLGKRKRDHMQTGLAVQWEFTL